MTKYNQALAKKQLRVLVGTTKRFAKSLAVPYRKGDILQLIGSSSGRVHLVTLTTVHVDAILNIFYEYHYQVIDRKGDQIGDAHSCEYIWRGGRWAVVSNKRSVKVLGNCLKRYRKMMTGYGKIVEILSELYPEQTHCNVPEPTMRDAAVQVLMEIAND